MNHKIVFLMRGLPSCGKSYTARKLAGDKGVVFETDEFFHSQVGDDPTQFNYCKALKQQARHWNLQQFMNAVDAGQSPIVVDRGNGCSAEAQTYARYALNHGYKVELKEPISEWWQEIRVLLKYKHLTMPILDQWATRLAQINQSTHRVSAAKIRKRMRQWRHGVTIEDIINYRPSKKNKPAA